jgi:hypothetical protein
VVILPAASRSRRFDLVRRQTEFGVGFQLLESSRPVGGRSRHASVQHRIDPLHYEAMMQRVCNAREDEGAGVLLTELVCQSDWGATQMQPQPAGLLTLQAAR